MLAQSYISGQYLKKCQNKENVLHKEPDRTVTKPNPTLSYRNVSIQRSKIS